MKTIEVILKEIDNRFIIIDQGGTQYSNCARKGDAKKVLKTKKGENLILVEQFTPTKKTTKSRVGQKRANHSLYVKWILENVAEDDRHSKSTKLKEFADNFKVAYYEKYNRCRVFEETVKKMKAEEEL